MKNLLLLLALLSLTFSITSCGDDDPDPINEEELITTLIFTLTPTTGGDPAVFQFKDPDGPGGVAPTIIGGKLTTGTAYTGSLSVLSESESPAVNIGEEIEEEDEEHQFFFLISPGLELSFTYGDQDGNGNPLGLKTNWTAGAPGSGTLKVILRHEPAKNAAGVADGDITLAGGETDIEVEWNVEIE
jgi:hypothetical protein